MSDTKIQWAQKTWNPVVGCTKVSAGCDHCYALAMARRQVGKGIKAYEGLINAKGWAGVRCLPERLEQPMRWRDPKMVFVCSMGDLFHEDVPSEFVAQVLDVCSDGRCEQHQFQVLTKRPERMAAFFDWITSYWPDENPLDVALEINGRLRNVWLGTSIENQEAADERIPHLLKCPAAVRFLSCEPLIGPLDNLPLDGIHWVIVGGETGPGARVCNVGWVGSIVAQCRKAGVPVFVKQLGSCSVGAWPSPLCVRQYPNVVRDGV